MSDRSETIIPENRDGSKAAAQRWQAFDGRGLKAPADCIDFAVVDVSTGKEVARVWEQADAIRLTAFPDLLEALKWIERHYANQDISHVDFRIEAYARALAAISRAEGQGT